MAKVGLALGGGSARGWAHIGVIRTLERHGIKPDIIVGTSVGAFVGAAYATGRLDDLEDWVRSLTWRDVIGFVDPTFAGGLVKARRIFAFFRKYFEDVDIETLDRPFAAVATDLATGQEVWIRKGSLVSAVRASVSIPGLITPVWDGRRWLVDGVLVNPVPASVCRALGADFTIAVDLNTSQIGRWVGKSSEDKDADTSETHVDDAPTGDTSLLRFWESGGRKPRVTGVEDDTSKSPPSLIEVIGASLTIMQVHITHARLAGEPPDVLVIPRLKQIGMMEYHRAEEAINAGALATERALANEVLPIS